MLGDLYHRRQRYGNLQRAIRNGAFDYILKPVSWKRLSQSLERFIQFYDQQREWKIVDQQNVDSLYQLQAKNYRVDSGSKGIEEKTLALVQGLFSGREAHCFPLMKWSAPPGSAKPPPVAIWSTALRPVFWKWRCCTEKLAIRGGCIAALRSKLKPSPDGRGWKRQKPRCSLISSGLLDLWAFCLAISIISGGRPFATSLSG